MMTIHKLTAGDGYTYLTRQVAGGDVQWEQGQAAAEYYTAKGNPPGRWMGRGAPLLGLDGEQVTEDQMKALFGAGMHPRADAIVSEYLAKNITAHMTERQLEALQEGAIRAATLGARFPVYTPLEHFKTRVDRRLQVIEQETGRPATATDVKRIHAEEARRARAAVAGFDVVFAPVKSAALLWALDPRPQVRQAVRQAHEAARDAALEMLEQHAAFTRTGRGGVAQVETNGLIAAVFDHYDSRAGDPNLHTHVAISSKIQGVDGKWRSLDARALYRVTVAASEFYNTAFETQLQQRIPVTFTERSDTRDEREPIREIAGIPLGFIEFFSSRRTDIEARYEQLLRQFRREHGYDPNRQVAHQLARQANLETRDAKKTARSLAEMRTDWTQSFTEKFGVEAIGRLMGAVPDGMPLVREPSAEVDLAAMASQVVARVSEMRSTWTVWNLRAEAERLARAKLVFDSPDQHHATVARIVEACLSPALSVTVDGPGLLPEPEVLQRSDGSSVFVEHASARFTSRLILDAEDRLVAAAKTRTAVGLAGSAVAAALEGFDARGVKLDAGQRQLVTTFATDDRLIVAGLGPAGAGKTTAMRAYAHVAGQAGQRIVALATSSAAADVLGKELGVRADNLHKFVHEYTRGPYSAQLRCGQPVPEQAGMFALNPGDVVLLDEAGMAGTLLLDRLIQIAAERGAVVRLLGDYRQLGAVESGGALRLIATEAGAVELNVLYRFDNPDEAEATLKIRVGDSAGLDFYASEDRIRSGSKQAMIEESYASWKADMLAGRTTLMAAATGVNVTALAAQARLDRVEAGQVEADGVQLHDGNLAGAGDWIVTRHNDRKLRVHRGKDWVKNGDAWSVLSRHDDGSLTVRHLDHRGTVHLPADYIAANVELLYATTTNRAQGSTVDTAHPLITPEMTRENLYVILSRARQRTVLHVVTHELLAYDPDDRLDRVRHDARQYAAREVLHNILAHEGNEISATESIRQAAEDSRSLAVLVPRHQYAATLLATEHYTQLASEILARPLAHALTNCDGWSSAVTALAHAEALGWPARHLLAATARDADLPAAETPGRLLAWRINAYIQDHPAPGPLAQPTLADTIRYADLLRTFTGQSALDPADATRTPAILTGVPATSRSPYVSSEALAGYAETTANALGVPVAHVATHRSWPHLAASLVAAHRSGRDIPGLIRPLTATLTMAAGNAEHRIDHLAPLARTVRRLLNADTATGLITVPAQLKPAVITAEALGAETADRLRAQPTWPALEAALRRAERDGHDPVEMLRRVAQAREFSSAEVGASRLLAWRLGRYLSTRTVPDQASEQPQVKGDWRLLAWTLKGLEQDGADLTQVLNLSQEATLPDVLHQAQNVAAQISGVEAVQESAPLPWLITGGPHRDPDHQLVRYMGQAEALISARVRHLADITTSTRPAWSTPLGDAPQELHPQTEWTRHVGIIAAYRDQQKVLTNDPRQILGPYPEPGRPERTAYWHAVNSIVAARTITGLDPEPQRPGPDPARIQVAVDVYLALPDDHRAAVHAAVVQRRGDLWFGDRHSIDDHAVTQPINSRELHQVLVERGHLTQSPADGARHEATDNRPQDCRTAEQQPVEAQLAAHRKAQRDTERAARMERARLSKLRTQARRKQQQQRAQQRRQQAQGTQAAPPLQPPAEQQNQRQERRLSQ
ncbi:MobF family relaxase [Sphaerisporangium sp. NPDC049003]|uniref:MobF family relaxase n=1 Tax=Sphaerisporangium sp. NPDC049003 TaxID=3364517 RepID=UPI00371AA98E